MAASSTPASRWRQLPPSFQLAVAGCLAYMVWHLFFPVGRTRPERVLDLGSLEVLSIWAGVWLVRAGNRSELPRQSRTAFHWLALGMLLQPIAGADMIVENVLLGRPGSIFGDQRYLFAASYGAAIIGLILLPAAKQGQRRGRMRALIDALAFLAGAGLPFWLFAVQPLLAQRNGAILGEGLVLPLIAFIGLLTISQVIETRAPLPNRAAFQDLLVGLGLLWLGDVVLSIDRVTGIIPGGTLNWINAANAAGITCCLLAGYRAASDPIADPEPRPLADFSPLPLITIIVEIGFVVLLATLGHPDRAVLLRLLVGLCAFLVVLLARETFVIGDSMQLLAAFTREEEKAKFERERLALEAQLNRALKMEAVGRLAGGVAHDFNNLLTIILANADLALLQLPEGDRRRTEIVEIQAAAQRGANLTGSLLAFSRARTAKQEAVGAGELLREAVPMLQGLLGGSARLATEILPGCGGLKVDRDEFVHALLNLTANARDAMPAGGTVAITAARRSSPPASALSYLPAPAGPCTMIEVRDEGSGMDEATRIRLFEPFFTTKERGRGTGLGLASVYGLMKASSGGIIVQSELGHGTAVQLWFPEVTPGPAAPVAALPRPRSDGTETLLVVDDEPAVRRVTERILTEAGYRVWAAESADEGERLFRAHGGEIDLVLLDVVMPGRSGPQLAEDLLRINPRPRVLFMSGFTGNQFEGKERLPVGVRLLAKPFTSEQLKQRIREELRPA